MPRRRSFSLSRRFAVPHRAASIPRPYNTATSSARPASTTVAGLLFWLRCMKKLCTSTTPNKGGNFQLTRAWFNPTKTCSRSPQPTGRSSLRFPTRAASFPGVARPRGRRSWNPTKRLFHTHGRAETPPKNAPEAHSPQVDRPLNARTRAANFLRVVICGSFFFFDAGPFFLCRGDSL